MIASRRSRSPQPFLFLALGRLHEDLNLALGPEEALNKNKAATCR